MSGVTKFLSRLTRSFSCDSLRSWSRINVIIKSWITVKKFFTGLPSNEILSVDEALSVVTVEHDFFRTKREMKEDKTVEEVGEEIFTPFQVSVKEAVSFERD